MKPYVKRFSFLKTVDQDAHKLVQASGSLILDILASVIN